MKNRKRVRRIVARGRHAIRAGYYYDEWDDLCFEADMVGAVTSDWGALEEPRKRFWQRSTPEISKPAFGFARALEG